ncbi:ribonuclease Z [Gemella cuniculi]|uniref:ribonuclease Z n=1 Tax=Gemella cuniculi TaxID=150240 RepID=UPI00041FA926|nr:ribonuclease Z [Gemella cuniculi]
MELQFLGTGAGLPAKFRNTQSFVFNFMQELKECWMFDCGEATQHQILKTNIRPTKISKIFISHLHADHILGLIGFLSSRSFLLDNKNSDITIYGPVGIKEFVEENLKFTYCSLTYSIKYVEFSTEQCIIDNKTVEVHTYPLKHNVKCYGYKIVFKTQKGSLNAEKLKKLGIMPGPFYKIIKNEDSFEFDGILYNSRDFLAEDKPRKEIVIIPDTKYFLELESFVKDSDIIISECTYLSKKDSKLASNYFHLSILDIEKLVSKSKVKRLFLTHISARYDKKDELEACNSLSTNIEVHIAHDLAEYKL